MATEIGKTLSLETQRELYTAATDLLEAISKSQSVKRGDWYYERKRLAQVLKKAESLALEL